MAKIKQWRQIQSTACHLIRKHTEYLPGESRMTYFKQIIIWRTSIVGRKYPNIKSKGNVQVDSTEQSSVEVVEFSSSFKAWTSFESELYSKANSRV